MPQAQTYQSEFTGVQMDERFRAVATLAEALTVLEQAIAAKYTKPASGIPSTDMDADVQAALALALTSVQSLADYYTKSEVDAMVAAVNAQEYIDVATLPAASADTLGKIYLVGPTSGEYARYITTVNGSTYGWVQIGTTEISMANYATKAELSQLDQQLVLSDSFRKEPSDLAYLNNASINTSVTPNVINTGSGYRLYYVFVKKGQTVIVHFTLSSGSCNSGTTTDFPALGVIVDNYLSRSSSYSERSLTAETDCYFVMRFSASVTTFYVELSNTGFGGDVKRYVDSGLSNIVESLDDTTVSLVGNGSTSVNKDFATIPGRTYDILLPETTWTVDETTNLEQVVFAVRTKSNGSYSDVTSTRVYRSAFGLRRKMYSFQAVTDVSNVFIRADAEQSLIFYIHEQNDPSVVGDYILAKKNTERLDTMQVVKQYRFIHHLNVEAEQPIIPSQSLYDIAYAKALGFKAIEGNLKKCSDGVVVIKHGANGGKLGAGLEFADGSGITADTTFASVSSEDLRNNVTYASQMAKYRGHIPTLAEFCQECARLGMIPLLRGGDLADLAEARKYLPDVQFVFEFAAQSTDRQDIKGMMTTWDSGATVEAIMATCKKYGRPFTYSWSNTAIASASDELITEVFKTLHKDGYFVGTSYAQQNTYQRLRKKGLDVFVPTYKIIPPFYDGNVLNIIGGGDERLVYQDASYDSVSDTITMQNGGVIGVNDERIGASLSKLCVRIRYNGTLSVKFKGSNNNENLSAYASDGAEFIEVAVALEKVGTDFLTIEADAATTVYDLAIFASVVM